ncbi:hypothetical protein [Corynebacterium cystitidis]|uniref:hypothetical protein n=1 Tax=Corynebacterium cystitidis TaxID=35757 RepID=UPI00211E483F|nr:hypothetical protein [Corynebacterium cystitidis]
MKRILVIGAPGTGKTHFSNQLSDITGIEVTHMDMLYWNADKTPVSRGVFRTRLLNVLHREQWIIDGTYNQTIDLRLHHCDTVFFLDYPVEIALGGLEAQRSKARADVPWEGEHPSPKVWESIHAFPRTLRPAIVDKLQALDGVTVHVFSSRTEADDFLVQARTPAGGTSGTV